MCREKQGMADEKDALGHWQRDKGDAIGKAAGLSPGRVKKAEKLVSTQWQTQQSSLDDVDESSISMCTLTDDDHGEQFPAVDLRRSGVSTSGHAYVWTSSTQTSGDSGDNDPRTATWSSPLLSIMEHAFASLSPTLTSRLALMTRRRLPPI